MASNHVDAGPGNQVAISPRDLRRSWSSNSSPTCGQGTPPKCVCAPATHAGSFKCRLHRAGSHSHPSSPHAPPASGPPPAVSSSSTRTVEAQ